MAVGKVCHRPFCPLITIFLQHTIEQTTIKRQEGYQEKGSRPLLPQRSACLQQSQSAFHDLNISVS